MPDPARTEATPRLPIAQVTTAVAVGVVLVLVAWPQAVGLQRTVGFAHAVALRGVLLVAAAAGAAGFLAAAVWARHHRPFLVTLGLMLLTFAAVTGGILTARGLGNPAPAADETGDITVLAWNTHGAGPTVIADLAIDVGADIVVLPETRRAVADEVAELMATAGATMHPHSATFNEVAASGTTALLISDQLGDYQVDDSLGSTQAYPSIVATPVDGDGPTIVAAHTVSPTEPEIWRRDLQWLADVCSSTDDLIIAGDFNATVDHMAGLAAPGHDDAALGRCVDAGVATGNGAVGTWRTGWPALLGSPIDHIMATPNWTTRAMRVIDTTGQADSDHRPVVAQLSPR